MIAYSLWLSRVFLAAREARFYGRVGDVQLAAFEHGQERMLKSKRGRLEQAGAEAAHVVEAAEVKEAQYMLNRLRELLSELAVEFGDDAQEMAINVVHRELQIRPTARRMVRAPENTGGAA